ncbi:MAG: aminopeptidase [Granulosicoccaceae bacterium]
MSRIKLSVACALCVSLLPGCAVLGYYGQAVKGHWQLMRARVPVQEVIDDPRTDQNTRLALKRAEAARKFASDTLGLPDNASYTTYVDIKRPAVTWNVIATRPLSIEPEKWCFPVAGCLSYRGYFRQEAAEAYAEQLRAEGLDVAVTQAGAYSSLGWFDDPLLSTMISRAEPLLAGVVFHELAHQQLYVKNDSSFNESFASFVERQGIEDWIAQLGQPELLARYELYSSRRAEFLQLLTGLRQELAGLYGSNLSAEQKFDAKEAAFERLRENYKALKNQWGGYSGYDTWFDKPLNNARVAGISTYNRWVGAFATLFADSGKNYALFYQRSAELAALEPAARQDRLEALLPQGG